MFVFCSIEPWKGFEEKEDVLDKVIENFKIIPNIEIRL